MPCWKSNSKAYVSRFTTESTRSEEDDDQDQNLFLLSTSRVTTTLFSYLKRRGEGETTMPLL